jgi:hypothetical protein
MGNHTTRGGKDGKDIKMANWPTALDKFLRDTEMPVRSDLSLRGRTARATRLSEAVRTRPRR